MPNLTQSPRIALTLIAVGILAATIAAPAKANFVLDQATHQTPIIDALQRRAANSSPSTVQIRTTRPRGYPIVQGFGNAIPLRQALPMIVPPYVRVHFEAGIDQTMPCSWRGGLPWPATINAAISPLGLRIIANPSAIYIKIKKSS